MYNRVHYMYTQHQTMPHLLLHERSVDESLRPQGSDGVEALF